MEINGTSSRDRETEVKSNHLEILDIITMLKEQCSEVRVISPNPPTPVFKCTISRHEPFTFALKVLMSGGSVDEYAKERFIREVLAAASIDHPNVVRGYAYHRLGQFYSYSMEYIAGGSLAQLLQKVRVPLHKAVDYLLEISGGLAAIHAAEILHLDLKPENILITEEDTLKIADFGISTPSEKPGNFRSQQLLGSLAYMSPEQLNGEYLGVESDIYSLGLLAYQLVTGDELYGSQPLLSRLRRRLHCAASPPSELEPECPVELDAVILKALERNPSKRYYSAREWHAELLTVRSKLEGSDGYARKRNEVIHILAPMADALNLSIQKSLDDLKEAEVILSKCLIPKGRILDSDFR